MIIVGSSLAVVGVADVGSQTPNPKPGGFDWATIGLVVAQAGALLMATDWPTVPRRLQRVLPRSPGVGVNRLVRDHSGLLLGFSAFGLLGVALQQLVVDRPLAAVSIVMAGLTVSRDVVIDPHHRIRASIRTIASVLALASFSFGPGWLVAAVVTFLVLAVVAVRQSPEPPTISLALWQVVLGVVAGGLGLAVAWLAASLSRPTISLGLALPALVLAVAAVVYGVPRVQRQIGFEYRRNIEFARGWPCAEIDAAGRVVTCNDDWRNEVGDRRLADYLDPNDWVTLTASLVQAQLTQQHIRLRFTTAGVDDLVTVQNLEIVPGPTGSSGLLHLRTERQAVSDEEVEVLRSQANTDALTGLLNRRGLEAAVAAEFDADYLVIFADLNGFKAINDSCGHDAGDEVLELVATRLSGSCRSGDCVARLGGDEFVVVTAKGLSQPRFQQLIDAMSFTYEGFAVTASVGTAVGEPGIGFPEVLAAADNRMYQAKRQAKAEQRH